MESSESSLGGLTGLTNGGEWPKLVLAEYNFEGVEFEEFILFRHKRALVLFLVNLKFNLNRGNYATMSQGPD